MCQDLAVEEHLRPRLIGSQTLGQQFFKYANIYGPVGPQAPLVTSAGDLEGPPGQQSQKLSL